MPPRRQQFSQADIDAQLQQIHLLDPSSPTENLESLAPLIKTIHDNHQVEAFLRTASGLVESKEKEIETICGNNYPDFVSSVSTLLTVRSYTENLRERIQTLDSSVSAVGSSFASKKKSLLQNKKTATNLDETIDTLQACLRVLDLVNRVGDMIKEGRYWSALKSLEDIESLPQSSLSQSPFFIYLLSSLPSLRAQVKDAVTASTKSWLLEIRNTSNQVGKLALEAMRTRTRRWKAKREKEPLLKLNHVGSAVELVTNEKVEYNVLDNDQLKVDFKPLYQCIHIYTALDAVEELQRSYQADRKTGHKAQASLILSDRMSSASSSLGLATTLLPLTEDIIGFFIIENHVLRTTRSFRSQREVEELWDVVVTRLVQVVQAILKNEGDVDTFLGCKDVILSFIQTLEGYSYETEQLRSLIMILFESYADLLERTISAELKKGVMEDDLFPMYVESAEDLEKVVGSCWLRKGQPEELLKSPVPVTLPWSQVFYLSCSCIRQFVDKFYSFVEGVSHHHRDIDELLSKALDHLLTKHVVDNMAARLATARNISQIAQLLSNIEHFQVACTVLEEQLMKLRATQRGGSIRLQSSSSFTALRSKSVSHLTAVVNDKLNDSMDMGEYDWTPKESDGTPSVYLFDMVNYLTTVVDTLAVRSEVKEDIYKGALSHIANILLNLLVGPDVPVISEAGIQNLLTDIDFLEDEFKRLGKEHLTTVFSELRETSAVVLKDDVPGFATPVHRRTNYSHVNPRRLSCLLDKLARHGGSSRIRADQERGEKRRLEAQTVARLPL
ncbi:hypothetical protein FRC04_010020 [Tulasnella sp. 424]|nr:hypothetical protein FRC04_010020 [Tulasnella sp. 424]KAG8972809.1 hypothetical protein FRC05_009531 [Tulasnella sp. 425]